MWKTCQCCEKQSCLNCNAYVFALKKVGKQDLNIKFSNITWRVYLNTNEHKFKCDICLVSHDF